MAELNDSISLSLVSIALVEPLDEINSEYPVKLSVDMLTVLLLVLLNTPLGVGAIEIGSTLSLTVIVIVLCLAIPETGVWHTKADAIKATVSVIKQRLFTLVTVRKSRRRIVTFSHSTLHNHYMPKTLIMQALFNKI